MSRPQPVCRCGAVRPRRKGKVPKVYVCTACAKADPVRIRASRRECWLCSEPVDPASLVGLCARHNTLALAIAADAKERAERPRRRSQAA